MIGEDTGYGTWAALRTVFGYRTGGGAEGPYARQYDSYLTPATAFKSAADGSGWIRADYHNQDLGNQNFILNVVTKINPSPPPLIILDYAELRLKWWDTAAGTTFVPKEVQDQLTGETVTTENGNTFAITSDLFTNVNGQRFLTGPAPSPGRWVTNVGKLTPIP